MELWGVLCALVILALGVWGIAMLNLYLAGPSGNFPVWGVPIDIFLGAALLTITIAVGTVVGDQ